MEVNGEKTLIVIKKSSFLNSFFGKQILVSNIFFFGKMQL